MKHGDTLTRDDGKTFQVTLLGHWSSIQAPDGETDTVKWYGNEGNQQLYVGATSGHSYKFSEQKTTPTA